MSAFVILTAIGVSMFLVLSLFVVSLVLRFLGNGINDTERDGLRRPSSREKTAQFRDVLRAV